MSLLSQFARPAQGIALAAAMTTVSLPAVAQDFKWVVQTAYASGDDLHMTFVRLAEMIEEMSGGRLVMEVSPGGAFVPAFDVLDAVNDGVIDAARGAMPITGSASTPQAASSPRPRALAWLRST